MKFSRIYCFRNNGAIVIRSIMIKQVIIAIILTSLLVGNSWDAEARERANVRQEKIINYEQSETKVREKRFINPFTSLFSVWNALTHIYSLYAEVRYFYIDHNYLNLMMFVIYFSAKKWNRECNRANVWYHRWWFQRHLYGHKTTYGKCWFTHRDLR